jgi:hypothetical protein
MYIYCELGSGSLHQHLQHLVPQALQRFQGCHAFCTTKRKCRPRQMSQHPVLGFQAHQRSLWLSCTTRPPLLTNAPWARCLKWLNTSDANLDVKWLKAVEGFMTMWKRKQIKCAYSHSSKLQKFKFKCTFDRLTFWAIWVDFWLMPCSSVLHWNHVNSTFLVGEFLLKSLLPWLSWERLPIEPRNGPSATLFLLKGCPL